MRRGATLIELVVVTTVLSLVAVIAVARFSALRDRIAVRGAANDVAASFALARQSAILRAERSAVSFDSVSGTVIVHAGRDTVSVRPLGEIHGVALASSRDSMAYTPTGLGFGAANLRVIARRGSTEETVFVSRLGRIRR